MSPTAMTVDDLMTRDVLTVAPDASLLAIRELLHKRGIHHILVVDAEQLVGVISDRDVLRAISPFLETLVEQQRDVRTLEVRAHEIMNRDLVTIEEGASLEKAAALLLTHDISSLPVVSAAGQIAGIVTSKDILRYTSAHPESP